MSPGRLAITSATLALLLGAGSCKSTDPVWDGIRRAFLPSRTFVVYRPVAHHPADPRLREIWVDPWTDLSFSNDSVIVTLKQGESWKASAWNDPYVSSFRFEQAGRGDSAVIRFPRRPFRACWSPLAAELWQREPLQSVTLGTSVRYFEPDAQWVEGRSALSDPPPRFGVRVLGRAEQSARTRARTTVFASVSGNVSRDPLPSVVCCPPHSRAGRSHAAVVTVQGTDRWCLTDSNGFFRLDSLPAGPVRLNAIAGSMVTGSLLTRVPSEGLRVPLHWNLWSPKRVQQAARPIPVLAPDSLGAVTRAGR